MTYTLYDFEHPTKGRYAWNISVWKARLTLNYKEIPYCTVFVPLMDAEKTGKALGAAPTKKYPDGRDWYTLPVLVFPDGSAVSDSFQIAKRLDQLHPEKSVIPEGTAGLQNLAVDWFADTMMQTMGSVITYAVADSQVGAGKQYMLDRAEAFGIPPPPSVGTAGFEEMWAKIESTMARVAKYIDETGTDASSVREEEPMFFDLAIVGALNFWKEILHPSDWARIENLQNGRWKTMVTDFAKYSERRD